MNYTLEDIYNYYCETEEDIDKTIFKAICSDFNILTIDSILEGGEKVINIKKNY